MLPCKTIFIAHCPQIKCIHSKYTGKPIDLTETIAVAVINALWSIVAGKRYSLDDPEPKNLYTLIKT